MAFSDLKTLSEVQKNWEFDQLVGGTFIQNRTHFTIDNLPILFGVMNSVFKAIQARRGCQCQERKHL